MRNEEQVWLENLYDRLCLKIKAECERTGSGIPYIPEGGAYYDMGKENIAWWTNGFWPGILWQMYTATGEELYKKNAEAVEQRMEQMLEEFVGLDHDAGFLWLLSAVAGYRITGNKRSCINALHAANILAGRFNPAGGFIRAWGCEGSSEKSGWMIIDCLMNLPLLYWASEHTKDPRYKNIAIMHTDTAMKYLLRSDGSVYHIANLDPETGELVGYPDCQGYSSSASWSRGQAWALYGMTLAHLHTGNTKYLEAAKCCAHYFIANTVATGYVPLCDFRAPLEPVIYDTSAGAIAASGLLALSRQVAAEEKEMYTDAAIKILKALDEKHCNWDIRTDSLLAQGCVAYHSRQTDVPLIYGDYFFIEAVTGLLENGIFMW